MFHSKVRRGAGQVDGVQPCALPVLAADKLKRAVPANPDSALEIGPGEGQFLQQIAPLFTHLMGIDRSQNMLQAARERLGKQQISAELVLGNWPHNARSEEHTSELQTRRHLVCRLLLENKKQQKYRNPNT